MKWFSFERKFHKSWHSHMRPFIESETCDEIFALLKSRAKEGERIMPVSYNTFKAFEIPLEKINVVILGGNPYDGYLDKVTVANGLFLDCTSIGQASYELKNFYKGIEDEVFNGLKLDYIQEESIKYLTDQGVMMLNAALTVEELGTHANLWEPFTKHVMKILDGLDVPIIFIGDLAQGYRAGISNKWRTLCLEDLPGTPDGKWDTGHTFRRVDEMLEEQNKDTIMWLNTDVPF